MLRLRSVIRSDTDHGLAVEIGSASLEEKGGVLNNAALGGKREDETTLAFVFCEGKGEGKKDSPVFNRVKVPIPSLPSIKSKWVIWLKWQSMCVAVTVAARMSVQKNS